MRTPNDYLRALLLELAEAQGLSDSAIARAHNRAYHDSLLAASTVQRFRNPPEGVPEGVAPSRLMEEAYAAATGTTRQQNWREAFKRWSAGEGSTEAKPVRRRPTA